MNRVFFNLLLTVPLSLVIFAGCNKAPDTDDTTATPSVPASTAALTADEDGQPGDVVNDFYTAWMDYEGNPVTDKTYENSDLVTAAFKANMTETIASSESGSVDPVLCAQAKPDRFTVRSQPVTEDSDRTTAVVTETFGDTTVMATVLLEKEDNAWKIDMIKCAPAGNVTSEQEEINGSATADTSPAVSTVPGSNTLAGEGEMCGGIDGISCETGLLCQYQGDSPDASGTCVQIPAGAEANLSVESETTVE